MPNPASPMTHRAKRSKKRSRNGRMEWEGEETMALHRSEILARANGSFSRVHFASPCVYEGDIRRLILELKYHGHKSLAPTLAEPLVRVISDLGEYEISVGVVTWAPTSPLRQRERGFDHGELLARHLGVLANLRCRRLLRRINNEQQTGQSRQMRLVQPRFAARPCRGVSSVCVVDDVMTTGATLQAAARALVDAGYERVICLSVSYVPTLVSKRACVIADDASSST